MLGVVLLYVGAVLFVNGVWLFGLARAQEQERVAAAGAPAPAPASYMIENKEVAVMNIFTGAVNSVVAVIALVYGIRNDDVALFALAGFVLLFGFTYLWVAYNQFTGVSGRGLGWFCLFVAVTAVPTGIIVFDNSEGDIFSLWLGAAWLAWAVLWFLYFLLLALEKPILRLTATVTIFEAVATAWAFGYVLLTEKVSGL
ncbi:MAG: AmiS/UreI family transporter [Gaiellaceae bacterium]